MTGTGIASFDTMNAVLVIYYLVGFGMAVLVRTNQPWAWWLALLLTLALIAVGTFYYDPIILPGTPSRSTRLVRKCAVPGWGCSVLSLISAYSDCGRNLHHSLEREQEKPLLVATSTSPAIHGRLPRSTRRRQQPCRSFGDKRPARWWSVEPRVS